MKEQIDTMQLFLGLLRKEQDEFEVSKEELKESFSRLISKIDHEKRSNNKNSLLTEQ